jgi:tetratricopeptide (TPR) repeat protein
VLIHVLTCYLEAAPASVSERLLLVSLLVRARRDAEARGHLDRLAADRPGDPRVIASRLQLELKAGQIEAAAAVAETFADWDQVSARVAHLGMLALLRAGRASRALELFEACADKQTADLMAAAVEAHSTLGDMAKAQRLAQRAISEGMDSVALRFRLGAIAQATFNHDRAIVHFTEALKLAPDDVRTLTALGEVMLFKNRPRAALTHLGPALEKAPHLDHIRALFARALKEVRDFDGAAREWIRIVERQPAKPQWKRQAASALNLAGRGKEARQLFSQMLGQRAAQLPAGFEEGLRDLWERVDEVTLPAARYEWAWRLRAPGCTLSREAWERRARWGHFADRLIFDWLECRPERAEEAMYRLADLEAPAKVIEDVIGQGEPLIIVTAHIGPMFAAPLAAELVDFETVWLASSPTMPGLAYTASLISTSDQTEAQVVRQAIRALESGRAVGLAVDGAMSPAAPRILFEGQEITYSSFAARLAHRRKANSVFVAPQWREERLAFHVAQLPSPGGAEGIEDFSTRWKEAYLAELRQLLAGEPENLRLSGGIWRHISLPT